MDESNDDSHEAEHKDSPSTIELPQSPSGHLVETSAAIFQSLIHTLFSSNTPTTSTDSDQIDFPGPTPKGKIQGKKKGATEKETPSIIADRVLFNKNKVQDKFVNTCAIDLKGLKFSPYRRPISMEHVEKVYNWHISKVHTFENTILTVSQVEGKPNEYYVIDGQHRIAAIERWNSENKHIQEVINQVKCNVYRHLNKLESIYLMNRIDEENGVCLHFRDEDIIQQLRAFRLSGDGSLSKLQPTEHSIRQHFPIGCSFHKSTKEHHLFVSAVPENQAKTLLKTFKFAEQLVVRDWRIIFRVFTLDQKTVQKALQIIEQETLALLGDKKSLMRRISLLNSPLMLFFNKIGFEHDHFSAQKAIDELLKGSQFENMPYEEEKLVNLLQNNGALAGLPKWKEGKERPTSSNVKDKLLGELSNEKGPLLIDGSSIDTQSVDSFDVFYINMNTHSTVFETIYGKVQDSQKGVLICRHKKHTHSLFNDHEEPFKRFLVPIVSGSTSFLKQTQEYLSVWLFGTLYRSMLFVEHWDNIDWIAMENLPFLIKHFSSLLGAFVDEQEAMTLFPHFDNKASFFCPNEESKNKVALEVNQLKAQKAGKGTKRKREESTKNGDNQYGNGGEQSDQDGQGNRDGEGDERSEEDNRAKVGNFN